MKHCDWFKALTEQFNLNQHVSIPIYDAGNTLELVLTRDDLSVNPIVTEHSVKSDHSAVLFTISCASRCVENSVNYLKGKSIDVSSVQAVIGDAFEDLSYRDSLQWELINHRTRQNYLKRNDIGLNMNEI